jgi:hypothetical protein
MILFGAQQCLYAQPADNGLTIQKNLSQSRLFEDEDILQLKLSANFHAVQKDRSDNPSYHPAMLSYKNDDSMQISIPIKIKARGNFRKDRNNCVFPPLLLNFPKYHADSLGLFMNQEKLKLVTHCAGDQYVIREWLVYKLYNLVTEKSFRARLVKVDYIDSSAKLKVDSHYGILIEDESQMAQRNGAIIVKKKLVPPQATNHEEYLKMTVFQYMIGNTDWSIPYLHNIRLISTDSTKVPYTVPYDFDHAGIVSAPYAHPAEQLELSSVRQRLYRGYCLPYTDFDETVKLYDQLKEKIYGVYADCNLLPPKYVKETTSYLDDFYKVINNEKSRLREFGVPCSPEGKQNILIKGLKSSDE